MPRSDRTVASSRRFRFRHFSLAWQHGTTRSTSAKLRLRVDGVQYSSTWHAEHIFASPLRAAARIIFEHAPAIDSLEP
jgi:hypothetical protein